MSNHRRVFCVLAFLLTALAAHVAPASAASCDAMTRVPLDHAAVTSAVTVSPGTFAAPGAARGASRQFEKLPAFCRVLVTSKPSSDSDIKIEVWLPASGWNGKFQAVGQGGLAGFIPYAELAEALAVGYAAAGTDTGHVGGNADFMPAHPEKLVDFAHRSIHEMAVVGKAVINGYYGNQPTWSYFNGCSGGGRHGLTSAQRYPDDFHGIVAGASTWNQARLDAARIAVNLTVNRTAESRIPASKYPMIHQAVVEACDALDGVKDGVLENPTKCTFDYAKLTCKGADGPDCLTVPQVESAKVLTSPLKDPATGAIIFEGAHLWPGSELEWATLGGPDPLANSVARVRNFHLKDPAFEFRLANAPADIERATHMDEGLVASNNYNLKPFLDRGGKLLMYHGWGDPQVPAQNSIIYYENVVKTVGKAAEGSVALFMIPGMLHCSGGLGTDTFDKMSAITQWVEQGKKPDRIVASHRANGQVDKTRPLCPSGQVAKYTGTGSTSDAANFRCVAEPVNIHRR
jgi:Tannase and feruloyl esterase